MGGSPSKPDSNTGGSSSSSSSSSSSKPVEFTTVLADKEVKIGGNFTLCCEANTEDFTATWEKNNYKLQCVEGKHITKKTGTKCSLEINKVEDGDDGNYTLTLKNEAGTATCSALVTVEINEWRTVQWKQDPIIDSLKDFQIEDDDVQELRFLLYGPVGAGKSSTINTIRSVFAKRQFIESLAAVGSGKSHSIYYEKYSVGQKGSFPFAFNDIMGVEKGKLEGVSTSDIINALKGHVKEGYTFNPTVPLTEKSAYYRKHPSMNDRMHCLVNIIPADKLSVMNNEFIEKIKAVREAASRMGMPQVVFLTRVDCVCKMTKENVCNIYKSRKIRDKMRECSNLLGVPTNCIFPVWNYSEETGTNENINCLMLDALKDIVYWANDYVVKCSKDQTHVE